MPKIFKYWPKWWNFAKSGHTDHRFLIDRSVDWATANKYPLMDMTHLYQGREDEILHLIPNCEKIQCSCRNERSMAKWIENAFMWKITLKLCTDTKLPTWLFGIFDLIQTAYLRYSAKMIYLSLCTRQHLSRECLIAKDEN